MKLNVQDTLFAFDLTITAKALREQIQAGESSSQAFIATSQFEPEAAALLSLLSRHLLADH